MTAFNICKLNTDNPIYDALIITLFMICSYILIYSFIDYYLLSPAAAAAAAAKSLQSCPTLCDPIDGSPPGSPIPEIL